MDGKKHYKHMILMILGCLLPLFLVIGVMKYTGGDKIPGGNFSYLFFLLCPLVHVFMMSFMSKQNKRGCHGNSDEDNK